jgi:hypothetical protein
MASTTIPTEAPERVNPIGRIFGVIFSPKATFESIVRKPTWFLPLLLLCLLSLVVIGIFGHRGGWPAFVQRQVANSTRFQQLSADQQQRALEMQMKIVPKVVYVEIPIIFFVGAVIIAAIFLGLFNGLNGTQISFKTSLGIVAHSWVQGLIAGLLALLIVSVKDPATLDLQNIVASNGAAFISSDAPRWQISLLGSLDIFSIWFMILLAIGYSTAAPKKLSFGKALAWVVAVWLVYVIVKVGATAAFS